MSEEKTKPVLGPDLAPHPHPVSVVLADQNLYDRHLLGFLVLTSFSILCGLIGLRSGPALGDHEAINALAARNALVHGRWLIPHLGDEPCIRKTPLGIWAIAATSKAFEEPEQTPVNELTARLPSAVAAILNVMAVYWLGLMLFGHRIGLVAGFITACCAGTLFFARNAQVDMILTLLTTLSFAFFWRGALHAEPSRRFMAGFFVCFGLAMLAKAPLPLVTVGGSLAVFWFVTLPLVEAVERGALPKGFFRRWTEALGRRFRGLWGIGLLPGVLVFLIVAGLWPLYVYWKIPNALDLWRIEYLDRFTGALDSKVQPFWYYLPVLLALTFPFLASLPEAVAAILLPRYSSQRRALGYVLTWALVTTVFLSISAFKRPHYVLSALPAYCLLLAVVVDRLFLGALLTSTRRVRITCGVLPLLIGGAWAGLAWYVQREQPAIARMVMLATGAAAIGWTLSALAFYFQLRRSSLAVLLLSVPLMLAIGTPVLSRVSINPEADALGKGLMEQGIDKSADIYWTDGRPNSAVEFYTGLPVGRLIKVEAAAQIREGRQAVPAELRQTIAAAIQKRMRDPKPAYFIMSRDNYERLAGSGTIPHRIAFEVKGAHCDPHDELVVFTQPAPALESPREEILKELGQEPETPG